MGLEESQVDWAWPLQTNFTIDFPNTYIRTI